MLVAERGVQYYEEQTRKYGTGSIFEREAQSGKKGIAFYYDKPNGKKDRKQFSGMTEEELLKKREEFLRGIACEVLGTASTLASAPTVSVLSSSEHEIMKEIASLKSAVQESKRRYKDATVRQLVNEVLDNRQNDNKLGHSGWLDLRTRGNNIIKYLGDKHISELTHQDFRKLMDDFSSSREKPYSEKTMKNIRSFFIKVLEYGQKHGYLGRDQLEDITSDIVIPNNVSVHDKNRRFIDYEELGTCLARLHMDVTKNKNRSCKVTDGMVYYLTARIFFLTGMRPQELFSLGFSDLFREKKYIVVRNALKQQDTKNGGRKFQKGTTKTESSVRFVPAIDEVFGYLEQLEKLLVATGARQKSYETGCSNYILVNKDGLPYNLHTFVTNCTKYQLLRGETHFTPYNLRISFVTQLDIEDAIENDVERAVGHKLQDVGNRHYRADNPSYVYRLEPKIKVLEEKLESAYRKALTELEIEARM